MSELPLANAGERTGRLLYVRLLLLMFLEYAALGAVIPLFSLHLQEIGLSEFAVGLCWATYAIGGLVSPPVLGQVADRWLPAQFCLTVCSLLGAVLFWLLAGCTSAGVVFLVSLAAWLAMGPTQTLAASLCFANLARPDKEFGRVRLWGTISWALTCLLIGVWLQQPDWLRAITGCTGPRNLRDALYIAGMLAALLGLYSLTLPHTPPRPHPLHRIALVRALGLVKRPQFAAVWFAYVGVCITIPFHQVSTPLLLASLGARDSSISKLLSLGQVFEVMGLAYHARLLAAWGYRPLMVIGMAAWLLMMTINAIGGPIGLVAGGILMNGICVSLFMISAQMLVNRLAHDDYRASAQALLSLSSAGAMLIGSVAAGFLREQTSGGFGLVFGPAAALVLAALLWFCWRFRESGARPA